MEGTCEKKLTKPQPIWQEGIGSLLLLAAAHQTGLLAKLGTTIQGVASSGCSSGLPLTLAVVERLILTLLFLPVAGLARTWDLRTYTGTLLALVTGRGCAYSYAYVEQFLSRLAHAQADEGLTDAMAQWTWALWHDEQLQVEQEQEEHRTVFYVDGHRKAVYSNAQLACCWRGRRTQPDLHRTKIPREEPPVLACEYGVSTGVPCSAGGPQAGSPNNGCVLLL